MKVLTKNGKMLVSGDKVLTANLGITPVGDLTITANGTYDVTGKARAIVNVPSSGGSAELFGVIHQTGVLTIVSGVTVTQGENALSIGG